MDSLILDRVRVSTGDDGVAQVCLSRADKMNALDAAMFDALATAIDSLKATAGLRAVVLHGAGRAFCAGLDMDRFAGLGEFGAGGAHDLRPRTHGHANAAQYIALGWRTLAVPVIAAVHGVAYGGGLQVALGADIRLVAAQAKLSVLEIKWGLVPDMAGIVLLRRLLRDDVARELCFTGRVVDGHEAVQLGLATRVCADPLADALAMARSLAQRSPDALRAGKRLWNLAVDGSDAALLQAESDEQVALMGSPNQLEAVQANLAQRSPVFRD